MVKSKSVTSPVGIKRLFWDIETSPNIVLAFRAGYEVTINHDAIIRERKIICIGYKLEGEKEVTILRWDKNQEDGLMLKRFLDVANEADELVHHFGDRFDLPWFRTRCLLNGFPPLPAYKTIDTKMWASKYYYFNSNKLDYLSKVLGHGGKEKMEFDDWKNILMKKDKKALDKMCHYCGVDVIKLEKVYQDLKYCVKPKSHAGVAAGGDSWTCPRTGTTDVVKSKTRISANGTITHSMQSKKDGSYYAISDSAFKKYLAAKKLPKV